MPSYLKSLIQYVLIFGATVFLIWFSLRGLQVAEGEDKWSYLYKTWQSADKGWLILMAGLAMGSHIARAERWRMLLQPVGYNTTLSNSFLSLMTGYLVNLVIPRGGEVSRCYNLYKLDNIPVETSFGTVVVERIIDMLCLMVLIIAAFVMEYKRLFAFIDTLPLNYAGQYSKLYTLLYLLVALLLMGIGLYWFITKNNNVKEFINKTWAGFKQGLLSIFNLKSKGLFIFYSLLIWFLYFLMSYTVIRAFPQTQNLGFNAVLSLFAIGSIAMAAPLPGGAGSYHVLVPKGLVFLYLIPESDAVAFTFIFHGWQTALLIVTGAISLMVGSMIIKNKSKSIG